jgi:hypothetical protein
MTSTLRAGAISWRLRRAEVTEAVAIEPEEHLLDLAVGDRHHHRGERLAVLQRDHRRLAVEGALLVRQGAGRGLAGEGLDQGQDAPLAHHRAVGVADLADPDTVAAAVGDQHGVVGEELEQVVVGAGVDRLDERHQQGAVLIARALQGPALDGDRVAGPRQQLAAGGASAPSPARRDTGGPPW